MTEQAQAKAYQSGKERFFYAGLAVSVAALALLSWTGASASIRSWAAGLSDSPWIVNALYALVFSLVMYAVSLPLDAASGYFWEHRFKLSRQTLGAWFKDDLKRAALSFALFLVVIEVLYFLLARYPATWWQFAAGFWLFLNLFMGRILPDVIIPLFYRYSRIADEGLRARLLEMFRRCGVNITDVFVIDFSRKTRKANAFICGLGKSRRVVLSDTLVSEFTHPEIEAVVAHELGHQKNRDIGKLIVVNTACTAAAFYFIHLYLRVLADGPRFTGVDDIALFPRIVLAFLAVNLLTMPLVNGFSRWIETGADRFCLRTTGNAEDFISMMTKLGRINLSEFQPSRFKEWMFYDHPPIARRIQFARDFQPGR